MNDLIKDYTPNELINMKSKYPEIFERIYLEELLTSFTELMCPLFAIEVIKGTIYVFRSVTLLVSQDQVNQLWGHVVESWNDRFDFVLIIPILCSKDAIWGKEFIVGQ